MVIDWAAPAAWARCDARFGALVDRSQFVGMEWRSPLLLAMRAAWIGLPRHGNLLHATHHASAFETYLRYAAINWQKRTLRVDDRSFHSLAAAFGAQLADVFEHVLDRGAASHRSFWLQPIAYIDLDDQVRVAFDLGAALRSPEMELDERGFVFVVGRLWSSLLGYVPADGVGKLIRRCIDVSRRARFSTLAKLRNACLDLSAPFALRSGERLEAWYLLEDALGWHALGDTQRAREGFAACAEHPHYRTLARHAIQQLEEPLDVEPLPVVTLPITAAPLSPPPPPSPARAAYLEGRQLLLGRKLHEAHAAFSSAILLDPMMLEAQLLRGQVERMLGRLRTTTGTPNLQPVDMPASLHHVRDLVVAGRIRDAIAMLSSEAYADNVDAPLFFARLLALDGQHERAASAFASITDGPHVDEARLGLARATIDRGDPGAALAILEDLLAMRPRDLGALEARARCLELLGRTSEASDAMRAFVAAVELASDARLSRVP